jgi:hypothetical protein
LLVGAFLLDQKDEMLGPKQSDFYPDRDINCQEAVARGIADPIEQAVLSGTSEAGAAAALAGKSTPGIPDLIADAKAAGSHEMEVANAIKAL